MKLIKILTIIILILFPFGELLRFEIGNNIAVKPLDIAIGLTAACWLVLKFINRREGIYYIVTTYWYFILFPLIGLLSLVINISWLNPNELLVSSFYLFRWIAYTLMFFIVSGFNEQFKNKIKQLLFINGLIILLLGFLQYFFFSSLKSYFYLGWDEHMYRMFSTLLDPNYAGAFFVLYFLFIGNRLAGSSLKLDPKYLVILLLTLIAIFLTFSRSALLMLIAGSFTYLLLIKRKKLILVIIGAIILFIISFYPKFNNENMNLFRETSTQARIASYLTGIKIIRENPFLGVGFNSYRYAKKKYGINMGEKIPSHADAGVDNSFLFVLATNGVIGFIVYAFLWFLILRKASILVVSSSIALFVSALFINSLFFPPLMLWMWLILALF